MGVFQYIVQILYLYKTSNLYYIHLMLMGLLLGIHIYFFKKQRQVIQRQNNPPQSNCSQKIQYVDYQRFVQNNTAKQLIELNKKPQFIRYMRLKQDPNSRYYTGNRNYEDVEQIVFSDEEDQRKFKRN